MGSIRGYQDNHLLSDILLWMQTFDYRDASIVIDMNERI
jgi:hypothetical protein